MLQRIRLMVSRWWNGQIVRVDPEEPDMIGGMSVMHETDKQRHWTAELAHSFVAIAGAVAGSVVTLIFDRLIT
jgi:hypothetical protein